MGKIKHQKWQHMGNFWNIWGHFGNICFPLRTYGDPLKTYAFLWEHMGHFENIWGRPHSEDIDPDINTVMYMHIHVCMVHSGKLLFELVDFYGDQEDKYLSRVWQEETSSLSQSLAKALKLVLKIGIPSAWAEAFTWRCSCRAEPHLGVAHAIVSLSRAAAASQEHARSSPTCRCLNQGAKNHSKRPTTTKEQRCLCVLFSLPPQLQPSTSAFLCSFPWLNYTGKDFQSVFQGLFELVWTLLGLRSASFLSAQRLVHQVSLVCEDICLSLCKTVNCVHCR